MERIIYSLFEIEVVEKNQSYKDIHMLLTFKKLLILLLIIYTGLLSSSCGSQEPIKIGFSAELSGKRADLGVDIRNGVQLAVDAVNAAGGINGRQLKLIIKDDQGAPEIARQVDNQLVDEGVVAIIGHATSSQTEVVLEQANQAKVVLLGPTASSNVFSNQDDYFFRVQADTKVQGDALAQYAYRTKKLRQVTAIYDVGNEVFSKAFLQSFVSKFESLGGEVLQEFAFTSGQTDLEALIDDVLETNPPALVFVSASIDTAFMAQYVSQQTEESPALLASGWAQTSELLAKGGQAVEGLALNTSYDPNNSNPDFQKFIQDYEERFSHKPGFGATYGYETVQVLAETLKQTNGEAEGLPEALRGIKKFSAIHGTLSLNEYGDVERDVYIMVVENGQYKVVETLSGNQ